MGAMQAKEYGLIDDVFTPKKNAPKPATDKTTK